MHLAVNIWWKPPQWQTAVSDESAAKQALINALNSDGFTSLVDMIPALSNMQKMNHGNEL